MKSLFRTRTSVQGKRRTTNRAFTGMEGLESRQLLTGNSLLAPPEAASDTVQIAEASEQERVLRIVNGQRTDDFESVGIVNNQCSGTLITPNAVLTAAHCIPENTQAAQTFEVGGATYGTSQVVVHPDYGSRDIDLAVMLLNQSVTNVEPSNIHRDTPEVGQSLTIVGFGATGTAQSGHDDSFGVKHVGQTPIDEVTATEINWNYDDPSESNTAPGDSGGPAFIQVDGQYVVAGVTSGGTLENAGLGDYSFDIRVDAFADWIDGIVGGTNDPVTDPPTDPGDDGQPTDPGPDDPVIDVPDGDLGDSEDFELYDDAEIAEWAMEELAWYDSNGDDQLSYQELVAELVDYGYDASEAEAEASYLIDAFDADGNQALNFEELVASYGPSSGDDLDLPVDDMGDSGNSEDDFFDDWSWEDDWSFDDQLDEGVEDDAFDSWEEDWGEEDWDFEEADSGWGWEDAWLEGDVDQNGEVGFGDFLVVSQHFGWEDAGYGQGDLDGDGSVGFSDFLAVSRHFGNSFDQAFAQQEDWLS